MFIQKFSKSTSPNKPDLARCVQHLSDPTTVCREMKTYLLWGYASPVGVGGSTEPPCNWGSLGKRPCVVCRHCRWSAWARSPRHVPAASSALCLQGFISCMYGKLARAGCVLLGEVIWTGSSLAPNCDGWIGKIVGFDVILQLLERG